MLELGNWVVSFYRELICAHIPNGLIPVPNAHVPLPFQISFIPPDFNQLPPLLSVSV